VPEYPLRAHFVSRVGIEIEGGAYIGVSDDRVWNIGRWDGGFDVIEDEISSAAGDVLAGLERD
jgi:hypothetical protein